MFELAELLGKSIAEIETFSVEEYRKWFVYLEIKKEILERTKNQGA
jgi:hypothetical protein